MSSGAVVTIVYGCAQFVLLFILAIMIFLGAKEANEKLSIRKFFLKLWKLRGVYTPLIVHIYDTATDIGVLYEWYYLAQWENENDDNNIKSLDMQLLFDTAIGFMIAYRVVTGICGIGLPLQLKWYQVEYTMSSNLKTVFFTVFGFILGALELNVFIGVYYDQKQNIQLARKNGDAIDNNTNKNVYEFFYSDRMEFGAGTFQKGFQFIECILESLPEVILQSVFLIRSLNDDFLQEREKESGLRELIIISVFASIISICNKFIWADEWMVIGNAKSFLIDKWSAAQNSIIHKFDYYERLPRKFYQFDLKMDIGIVIARVIMDQCFDDAKMITQAKKLTLDRDVVTLDVINGVCAKLGMEDDITDSEKEEILSIMKDETRLSDKMIGDIVTYVNKGNYEWVTPIDIKCPCYNYHSKYSLSYGFVFRVLWRLSAVTSRFAIFSLIWVELGGAFLAILGPSMMILWYLLIIGYLSLICNKEKFDNYCVGCGGCCSVCKPGYKMFQEVWISSIYKAIFGKDIVPDTDHKNKNDGQALVVGKTQEIQENGNTYDNNSNCNCNFTCDIRLCCINTCCTLLIAFYAVLCLGWQVCLFIVVFGFPFQLGIFCITGKGLYIIRMIENVVLMSIITLFAFNLDIDCKYCVDPNLRSPLKNERAFVWIVVAWVCVISHILLSFVMNQIIDNTYALQVNLLLSGLNQYFTKEIDKYQMKKQQKTINQSVSSTGNQEKYSNKTGLSIVEQTQE